MRLRQQLLFPDVQRLALIEPIQECWLLDELLGRQAELREQLLLYGGLLFRGFRVEDLGEFDRFIERLAARRMPYRYRSTPRTDLGRNILTATEYSPVLEIPLHCENSYQLEWPLIVAFCCVQPATTGGATPLADMRRVSAELGSSFMDEFEVRQVRYIRHYWPHIDVSWQSVFQTDSREDVRRFCASRGIDVSWIDEDTLRTCHVAQGTAYHPSLQERVFFNQAHLFHVSSLGSSMESSFMDTFGRDRLPRHATFGDGAEITADQLLRIRRAFRAAELHFQWRRGDVLVVDNMQLAHGRAPFSGPRSVLVALLDPFSPGADRQHLDGTICP